MPILIEFTEDYQDGDGEWHYAVHEQVIQLSEFLEYLRTESDFYEERMRLTEDDKVKLRRLLEE